MQLTTLDIKRIKRLRYQDGLSCVATGRIIGCSSRTVWHYAPGNPGKIPNTKLREAFHDSGITATELARRMGWLYPCEGRMKANGSAVKVALGILSKKLPSGTRCFCSLIDAELAGTMAEALGLMAWEVLPDEEERLTG